MATSLLIVFGTLTSVEAPQLSVDGPTPWIGVWERLGIACYFAWLVAFAVALLRPRPLGRFSTEA